MTYEMNDTEKEAVKRLFNRDLAEIDWADLPVAAARCLGFKTIEDWELGDVPVIEIQTTILPSATTPNEDQGIEDEINSAIGDRTMLRIYAPVEKVTE